MMKPKIGRLHVITDTRLQTKYSHSDLAKMAVDGGADTIQYREKVKSSLDMCRDAEQMMKVCVDADVPLIINDRLDIALAVDAHGVHLGQSDLPISAARKLLGNEKLIGGSAESIEELDRTISEEADYAGFGPVFGTGSKHDTGTPKGIELFEEIVRRSPIPVIAIGGIKPSHVRDLLSRGVYGIAVISAVCCADDPRTAAGFFAREIRI